MLSNKTHLTYVLLAFTSLFWGGNSVAGKMAVGEISPMLLNLARWVLASSIILPFALPELKREWPTIKKHRLILTFYGAVGFTLFNILLYTALIKTSAVSAAIVQAALPATVYLLNFILFRVTVTIWQIAGFFFTLAGVLLVATRGEILRLTTLDLNAGDALILVAVVVYAIYTVLLRYKPKLNWKSLIVVLSCAAALAALPGLWWEWQSGGLILPGQTGLLIALYTGIFPSIISQLFFIKGVELIGANRAGIFISLIPIFGTGLAILLLGEPLETFHIIALMLVIAGIWLAERRAV